MKKMKWYQIAPLCLVGAILLFQAWMFIGMYLGFRGSGPPITSVSQLSPDVPLSFPSDALIINGEYHTGLGAYLIAKVRFKRSEVHAFISQSLLAPNGTNSHSELMRWPSTAPGIKRFNWQLKSIHKFWAIDNVMCRPNDGNSQAYVIIDLDNPGYVDVYTNRFYR
jgi:hypothetical protein